MTRLVSSQLHTANANNNAHCTLQNCHEQNQMPVIQKNMCYFFFTFSPGCCYRLDHLMPTKVLNLMDYPVKTETEKEQNTYLALFVCVSLPDSLNQRY